MGMQDNRTTLAHHSRPPSRLNREDHCLPSSHDRLFAHWKVLVGPTDWQNHCAGLEGAERYRLHNLPSSYFGPGVYELALHLGNCTPAGNGTKNDSRCLQKDAIIVVYVGQAENVRTRLQHYGRSGSHLEGGMDLLTNGKSHQCETTNSKLWQIKPEALIDNTSNPSYTLNKREDTCSWPHLFTMAFSRGYSIAFRWTATRSKSDAAAIETGLLKFFDYAWNRGSNGERRPYDAFKKERMRCSVDSAKAWSWDKPFKWTIKPIKLGFTKVSPKVCNLQEKRSIVTVVKDRLRKLNKLSTRLSVLSESENLYCDLLSLPWKFQGGEEKSLPSPICSCNVRYKDFSSTRLSNGNSCGILDARGVACKEIPVQGRKRCAAHKGMRSRTPCITTRRHSIAVHACKVEETKSEISQCSQLTVCGYVMVEGSKCMALPEKGRKRCLSHKGRRVRVQ